MRMPSIYYRARIALRQKWRIYKFRWIFFRRALSNYWRLRFGIIAFLILAFIIYKTSWSGSNPVFKTGDRNTWQNIASELHGLLFDILLFGIVFVIFEKVRDKREIITRYLEELDDYRGWDSAEAYQRTHGLLRRLIDQQFYRISMIDIFMKNQRVHKPLNFEYSVFQRAVLENTEFYNTYFISPSFLDTDFTRTQFDFCRFDSPTFSSPRFWETQFNDCEFSNAAFHGLKIIQGFRPSVYFRNCKLTVVDFKYFNVFAITDFVDCTFEACEAFQYQEARLVHLGITSGVTYKPDPHDAQQKLQNDQAILNIN